MYIDIHTLQNIKLFFLGSSRKALFTGSYTNWERYVQEALQWHTRILILSTYLQVDVKDIRVI